MCLLVLWLFFRYKITIIIPVVERARTRVCVCIFEWILLDTEFVVKMP